MQQMKKIGKVCWSSLNNHFKLTNFDAWEQIPREGVIGYATNDAAKAYGFLQGPCQKLGFQMKDFSAIQSVDEDVRLNLVAEKLNKFNFGHLRSSEAESKEAEDEAVQSDSGVVLINGFPRDLSEAQKIESETLGLNLYIDIKFEQKDDYNTTRPRFNACPKCGALATEQASAGDNRCCGETGREVRPFWPQSKQTSDSVVDFYRSRNAYMDFTVRESESKEENQARFFHELLHNVRY